MTKELITTVLFDVSSRELVDAFTKKAQENREKADVCGHMIETGLLNRADADLVKAACKLLNEHFDAEDLPTQEEFIRHLKRHREDFSMKAESWGWCALHVIENSTYRLSNEDLQRLGIIDWPVRLYGNGLCDNRKYSKMAMEKSSEG